MRIKLQEGETLKKDWICGKSGLFGNSAPLHLAVTNKRLIFYREKGNAVSASSVENSNLEGFEGSFEHTRRTGLIWFGYALFVVGVWVSIMLITKGGI